MLQNLPTLYICFHLLSEPHNLDCAQNNFQLFPTSRPCLPTFFQELLFNMSDIFLPSVFLSIYSLLCKCFCSLGFNFRLQGLADHRLWFTSVPSPTFVNKFLLEHRHTFLFTYCLWQGSCDRVYMPFKPKIFILGLFYRKKLAAPL